MFYTICSDCDPAGLRPLTGAGLIYDRRCKWLKAEEKSNLKIALYYLKGWIFKTYSQNIHNSRL